MVTKKGTMNYTFTYFKSTIDEIREMPSSKEGLHESVFRSWEILKLVKEMIARGDSLETLAWVIAECESPVEELIKQPEPIMTTSTKHAVRRGRPIRKHRKRKNF